MLGWDDVRREPFRLLFPLGAVSGLLGVGHWLAYAAGWSPSYSGFYHASLQVGVFALCFILGFLMTALPRFLSAPPASHAELGVVLALLLAQPILLSLGRWVEAEGCFAALLLALAIFAGRRALARRAAEPPPTEFVWIPIALLHGLLGAALLMAAQVGTAPAWMLAVGRPMVQQGFLLGMVVGVGGFMAPRLMGHAATPALTSSPDDVRRSRQRRVAWHAAAGAVFFSSFWLEGFGVVGPAYLLRAAVVTAVFVAAGTFPRPPRVSDLYVRLLWAAVWMIVLGLWGAGLWPRHRAAMLHLVFLGGVSLMIFAVGTMVVLSHAGEGRRLRAPLPILWFLGMGTAAAVGFRLAAEWRRDAFFPLLALAAVCWLLPLAAWLAFLAPRLLHVPSPGTFEHLHEAAKARLRGEVRATDAL